MNTLVVDWVGILVFYMRNNTAWEDCSAFWGCHDMFVVGIYLYRLVISVYQFYIIQENPELPRILDTNDETFATQVVS